MLSENRISYIKNALYTEKKVSISDISERLNISYPTVRKYFNIVAQNDPNIKKVYGGLEMSEDANKLITYSKRLIKNGEQKKEIATKALKFITERSTILMDSSTTTYELACLMVKLDFQFTVITNGISTARLLSQNDKITTIVLPGILHKDSNTIIDDFNFDFASHFNIDQYIFSASGLSLDSGFSEYNLQEVSNKRNNVKKAKQCIALIDSSKFCNPSSANFAKLEDVDILITDSKIDKKIYNLYKERVQIIC
ncbi:MAG: DeoR/GlpR family DNA-binding transcription regulator [Catenisphaera adipataccumulans]|jgi:DeoR/GlpR family transcriptional regulator of sugar metabolism|uniref:DeoR/GlpR family DNA-binding transcription regulator n=1 Tax=Catenisphaera adipataccumulans TaxID=700500 RepID=UPI003D8D05E8